MTWHEQGGRRPPPDAVMGFGSRLIENGIPNAVVRREFRTDGLFCAMELPLPADYQSEDDATIVNEAARR